MNGPVTSLRISTVDPSNVQSGSGDPVSARAEEGTSQYGYTPEDLAGVVAFNSMAEFVAATQDPRYKSDYMDPRGNEAFRELCAKRLAKMEMHAANRAADFYPANDAEAITQIDASIPLVVAQAAVKLGGFPTRESRDEAFRDPRYKVSEDFRNLVAARSALSSF